MNGPFHIKKILNNNAVVATNASSQELIIIGKGIGFGKALGDFITNHAIDKLYILTNEKEQEQYKTLVHSLEESFIELLNDVITHIEERMQTTLNEHIHVALTDHVAFAVKRLEQGMDIRNPFLSETQTLYPKEYTVAEEVIEEINQSLGIHLPEGEIGFVALHIHSAVTNKSLSDINEHSRLINRLADIIEESLSIKLNRKSINFLRLVRHLRHTIERVEMGEQVDKQEKLAKVLKEEYPLCYNLAWKLIKVMQNTLNKPIPEAEAVYLTMHLQRLT
ncbi:glucose PTS transporter transcription antiterminator GlcT [Fictibacillus terranigra]|uniref:Transcription antiterminator n=1 Tax=Fictibacillus terranigra TaxID=3058424 RepID=A0ABT8E454_9BACL|nr:transcription antiterminator [Fictibacillus sp. CENA-BCM004]MDN4072685.1 transcription antiterminator [Fictibacillus sp. CENA-BCM004]